MDQEKLSDNQSKEDDFNKLIELIAKSAAEEAIRQYHKEEVKSKKARHDRRLYNTKLILKNYQAIKTHSDSSIAELSEIVDDDVLNLFSMMLNKPDSEEIKINSIKNSVARTRIILEHVDTMLSAFQKACSNARKPADRRRYNIIRDMYLSETKLSAEEVAEMYGIDVRTVFRDVDAACETLSTYLFGIDWM